jgi:hypothetical protein
LELRYDLTPHASGDILLLGSAGTNCCLGFNLKYSFNLRPSTNQISDQ